MRHQINSFVSFIILVGRFLVIIPVITSIVAAVVMMYLGTFEVYKDLLSLPMIFTDITRYDKTLLINIISALDDFIIATVLIIFAAGLYELVIDKLPDHILPRSSALNSKNINELKEKVAKVIIMALIITFFKAVLKFSYNNSIDLLYISVGIALVAFSNYLTNNLNGNRFNKQKQHHQNNNRN